MLRSYHYFARLLLNSHCCISVIQPFVIGEAILKFCLGIITNQAEKRDRIRKLTCLPLPPRLHVRQRHTI